MNPIIKSLIKSKTCKTYELKELHEIIFKGDYKKDILVINAKGICKNNNIEILRESNDMVLSSNEDKISLFKDDVLKNLKCDKVHSFYVTINFKNESVTSDIKFYLDGKPLQTTLRSKL